MAIVEMKKLTLLGLKADKQRLLKRLQHMGAVQVIERDMTLPSQPDPAQASRLAQAQNLIGRMDLAIARLSAFDPEKRGMLSLRPEAGEAQVAGALALRDTAIEVVGRVEEIERTRGELRGKETRYLAQIDQLTPWQYVDIPLNRTGDTKYAAILLVTVPTKAYAQLVEQIARLGAAMIEEVTVVRDQTYAVFCAHKDMKEQALALLREAGAARVQFDDVEGTAALGIDQLRGKLARIEEVRAKLTEEMKKLAEHLPTIRLVRDIEATERDRLECEGRCVDTKIAFLLQGWAPAEKAAAIEDAVKKIAPDCQIEFAAPEEGETPPTYLHNNKVATPFESIVRMFSLPSYEGFDPTLVMMPFWVCFFGMMVSDAGYGVLIGVLAGLVFWKLKGKGIGGMAFILALGGVSTVIWGAIYGGWFGMTPYKPLLDPMNDALKVLIVCAAAGAVHLVVGMGCAAYMNIRRGKPLDALFDQGFWLMILLGFGLCLLNTQVGLTVAAIGALGVLLTAGRAKTNIFSRLIGGLGSLYGITGYLSDLLSYARLFGMGLATGVIGMVVNLLAGLLMTSPVGIAIGIVVLIFGHTLNLLINTLGAYVHACRLQFIEFFGKFYESGGRDFRPLTNNTRYVDIAPAGDK